MIRPVKIALIVLLLVPILFQTFAAITLGIYWLILLPFGLDPASHASAVSNLIGVVFVIATSAAGTIWVVLRIWPSQNSSSSEPPAGSRPHRQAT